MMPATSSADILGANPLPSSMAVATDPGSTLRVASPVPRSSSAKLFVKPTTPHFAAQYADARADPSVDEMLATWIRRPTLRAHLEGKKALVPRKVPPRSASRLSRNSPHDVAS